MAPLIDSLEQISEKARIEIKAWLEPWFEGRKAGGPGPNPRIDSTENVGDRWGVHSVEPDGAFERLRQFLKTDGAGGSKWGPQTIGEAFQGVVLAQDDLFAYWVMDEASGTLADLGPHNIPMAPFNAPIYGVAGPFPPLTAIDLNNQYFTATITGTLANLIFGDASVGVKHPFTIAAVANMPALADTVDAVFTAHSGSTQIALYFSTVGGDNVLYTERDSDGGNGVEQPINRNQILVYRYDGTNMELFVDGLLVDTKAGNDNMGPWGTTTLSIGGMGAPTILLGSQAIVSNVALFTDAISDEVLAQISAGFALGGTGGALNIDHGGLYGLADDDHPQYLLRSVVTTIGDLIVATTAGVLTRLGNGSAQQVLEADPSGAAPGVKWATRIRSLAKSGSSALFGDVTLTGGANVTLTQAGQNIEIAATVVGSGAVDSIAASGDTPMVGDISVVGVGVTITQDDVDVLTITGTAPIDKQVFTLTSQSPWNKPAGAKTVHVICIGGGGGGGGGFAGTGSGGGGGGGGARMERWFDADDLGGSEAVVVAAAVGPASSGSVGTGGNASSFGSDLAAFGGGGGQAGASAAPTGGGGGAGVFSGGSVGGGGAGGAGGTPGAGAAGGGMPNGPYGGGGGRSGATAFGTTLMGVPIWGGGGGGGGVSNAGGNAAGASLYGGGGGGAGGGTTAGSGAGGAGGAGGGVGFSNVGGGAAGGTGDGGAGAAGSTANFGASGSGGGGGSSKGTGTGGAGGDGGTPGGGGGGGGRGSSAGGAGGIGQRGEVIVTTYF